MSNRLVPITNTPELVTWATPIEQLDEIVTLGVNARRLSHIKRLASIGGLSLAFLDDDSMYRAEQLPAEKRRHNIPETVVFNSEGNLYKPTDVSVVLNESALNEAAGLNATSKKKAKAFDAALRRGLLKAAELNLCKPNVVDEGFTAFMYGGGAYLHTPSIPIAWYGANLFSVYERKMRNGSKLRERRWSMFPNEYQLDRFAISSLLLARPGLVKPIK